MGRATRQLALRKALSARLASGDVIVIDDIKLATSKTKEFVAILSTLQIQGSALIVSTGNDQNLLRAARNVQDIEITTGDALNTYQVLRPNKLIFTRGAFEQVESRLAKE